MIGKRRKFLAEPKKRRINRFGRETEKVFNLLLCTDH